MASNISEVYMINIVFTDDIGKQASLNISLTVLPKVPVSILRFYLNVGLSFSLFFGIILYLSYILLWSEISEDPEKKSKKY